MSESDLSEKSAALPKELVEDALSTSGIALRSGPSVWARAWAAWVELLSSMRFAVALLAVIGVASVIGTIIEQEQAEANYINQFGLFWAEVFMRCQLHRVYSSWWFLLMLGFLVVSTSLCIARHTPKIMRQLGAFKEDIRVSSFRGFPSKHRAEAVFGGDGAAHARRLGQWLANHGWRVKLQTRADGVMLAAKAGALNKLGYIATHAAIVLVCIGGLIDGDLLTKAQLWLGYKSLFNGEGLVSEVPPEHRLSAKNPSYRVNLLVSEGMTNRSAVQYQTEGVLVQDLPFSIELKKFVVEYYSTGMPKVFASEVVIHDDATGEATPARIEVNKPFNYRGVNIYQSSFEDGGSAVKLQAWPLRPDVAALAQMGRVGQGGQALDWDATRQLELTDLRPINVENFGQLEEAERAAAVDVRRVDVGAKLHAQFGAANKDVTNPNLRNIGPAVQFKLRDAAGQALEFESFMLPVQMPGERHAQFMFGVRSSNAEGFRYLRIPVDAEESPQDFFRLARALHSPNLLAQAAERYAQAAVLPQAGGSAASRAELVQQLEQATYSTLERFSGLSSNEGVPATERAGLPAVARHIEQVVPAAERDMAGQYVMRMLTGALLELLQMGREASGLPAIADAEAVSYATMQLTAVNDAFAWPVPVVYGLSDFEQVQASVFQLTKGPGKWLVYLACVLLMVGVLAMLYVRDQRLWVWLAQDGELRMAYSSNRPGLDSDRNFAQTRDALLTLLPPVAEQGADDATA